MLKNLGGGGKKSICQNPVTAWICYWRKNRLMFRALVGNQENQIQLSVSYLTTAGLFHFPCSLAFKVKIGLFFSQRLVSMISLSVGAARYSDDGRSSDGCDWRHKVGMSSGVWVIQPQMMPIGRTGGWLGACSLSLCELRCQSKECGNLASHIAATWKTTLSLRSNSSSSQHVITTQY